MVRSIEDRRDPFVELAQAVIGKQRKMPTQKPGNSEQDVQTPPELLRAIERQFHVDEWTLDLAANAQNAVCDDYLGPGSLLAQDALSVQWPQAGDLWLNPPFADIEPWVAKAWDTRECGARIFVLVPASIGSAWYQALVFERAHVIALAPRVTFVGHASPYPKDLILAIYSAVRGGFSTWRWK